MDAGSWMEALERASERLVADRLLASVGRPDLFMEMCVSYLAASEMLSIVENLNDAGVGVLSGLVRKMKRK